MANQSPTFYDSKPFQFSPEAAAEAKRVMTFFPEGKQKSAILRLLHLAQDEAGGWLPIAAMDHVAEVLSVKPIEVYEVATFYSMFNIQPVGKYLLEVCQTGPCMAEGSDKIIEYLSKKLGIEVGGTTADGMFTLKAVECLGACGYAPMLQLGDRFHEFLDEEKVDKLLADCRAGLVPNQRLKLALKH